MEPLSSYKPLASVGRTIINNNNNNNNNNKKKVAVQPLSFRDATKQYFRQKRRLPKIV